MAAAGGGGAAGAGIGMAGLAALLQGGSAVAGLAGGSRGRTPGFGITNIDEIATMLGITGFGKPTEDELVEGNLVDLLGRLNMLDLPQLDQIGGFASRATDVGMAGLSSLEARTGMNTTMLRRLQAQGTAGVTGALEGGFEDLKESTRRDLGRTVEGIFNRGQASAVARGIKSSGTGRRSAFGAQRAAESVFDQLSQIGVQETLAQTQVVGQRATGAEQLAERRAVAGEDVGRLGIDVRNQLFGERFNRELQLLGTRRSLATEPARTRLDIIKSFPVFGGGNMPATPSFSDRLSGSLANLSTTALGFGASQRQQGQDAQMQAIINKFLNG